MHGIAQTTNGQMMTAWTGDTPWHNLGQQAKGLMTSAEALEMAHSAVEARAWDECGLHCRTRMPSHSWTT